MKVFLSGECRAENIWQLDDPASMNESEFEIEVVKALKCVFKDYHCIKFRGNFLFEGFEKISDLALIHHDFSHWFVVEVELAHHPLNQHVIPQVTCFRFGDPLDGCPMAIRDAFENLSISKARDLVQNAPRGVVVVSNRYDRDWAIGLETLQVQYLVLSLFSHPDGRTAYELEGSLRTTTKSLGYATYSAINQCFICPLSTDLPRGMIQIEDPYGVLANWVVRETTAALWVSRELGDSGFQHLQTLQLLRSHSGRIALKLPNLKGISYNLT